MAWGQCSAYRDAPRAGGVAGAHRGAGPVVCGPLSLLVRTPIAPSSLAMRSRGSRTSRSRRGSAVWRECGGDAAEGVELKKKGGLRYEGRPELQYRGWVSRPLSRRTLRRQP